jgi:thioredoxin-like negative regulator of GroEL
MNYDENTREGRHLTPEERIALQAEEIKQLWQENEQLRARAAQYREALIIANHRMPDVEALSDTPAEYHNPADVKVLKQAREALTDVSYCGWLGSTRESILDTIEAIDKALGGEEDV